MTDEKSLDTDPDVEPPQNWFRRHAVVLICVLNISVGVLVAWFVVRSGPADPAARGFEVTASALQECEGRDQTCYRDYLQQRTTAVDPRAAIADVDAAYGNDPFVKKECHELVHVIGHAAYDKYQSVKTAFSYGETSCEAGYYHGVVEKAVIELGVDAVVAQANDICSSLTTGPGQSVEAYNCTHGLGHGFMAATNDDLYRALSLCDALNRDEDRSSCHAGVFMENVNKDGEDGQALSPFLKPEDPLYPCTAVEAQYLNACYTQQSPFIVKMTQSDPARAFALCNSISERRYSAKCIASLGTVAYFSTSHNQAEASKYCDFAPGLVEKDVCVQGIAVGVVTFHRRADEANTFCDTFAEPIRSDCHKSVADAARSFQ